MNAMMAAKVASADNALVLVVESAVTAAVAHQAEDYLLKASAEAATASRMAAESAAEAVKLSNQAREISDSLQPKR